jgi:hypothetical protein
LILLKSEIAQAAMMILRNRMRKKMRLVSMITTAAIALANSPIGAAAASDGSGQQALAQRQALLRTASILSHKPVELQSSPATSVQLIPACFAPGQMTCINGWRWVCQCYSYGCQFMTTAYRC